MRDVFGKNGFSEGRMISGSKSGYRERHPNNDVVFNSRIFVPKIKESVWWGDLDITLDCKNLQNVCNEINTEMLVFFESTSWYAEGKSYRTIKKHAHAKFTPNSKTYQSRVYNGLEGIVVGNMTIVTSKGINWIEKEIPD